eukprot:TRINITY_DN63820_c0_g1_i2.p1 TRINITY_DN63820_c0_g1~~TRINITY_DN63820_c0_g1_i2.p1  ORF type:complete len:324 (+),score=50.58 TRINITY_DN63820_c0_g1_i2:106-1077(+)
MGKKYVVMIDGSELAKSAAQMCAKACHKEDEVHLYSCFVRSSYIAPAKPLVDQHNAYLSEAAAFFESKGPKLVHKVEPTTEPRSAVTEYCRAIMPDYIFMGSRGMGELKGLFGSVSHYLLHHWERGSICIVKSAPPADQEGLKYLVCTDCSGHANRAVDALAATAQPEDTITVYAGVPSPPRYETYHRVKGEKPERPKFVYDVTEKFLDAQTAAMAAAEPEMILTENENYEQELQLAKEKAETYATTTKNRLMSQNTNLKADKIELAPKVTIDATRDIIKAAEKVDCVVMGTRGLGIVSRMVFGSVSNSVLHNVEDKAFLIVH